MYEFITSQFGFFTLLTFFGVGALGSLALQKNDKDANNFGNLCAIVGSCYGLLSSGTIFISGIPLAIDIPSTLPFLTFSLTVDRLSAFFVFLICLIALPCSIYALTYIQHFFKKQNIGSLGFFYNIFIVSMLLVVTAHHALFFLIVWEIMSLVSYFLVTYESNKEENIKAGSLYFIMTHAGTAFIIVAFLLMYKVAGSFDFEVIKHALGSAPLLVKDLIFVCALIGFGTKAGIIPLHIWLPSAHPAAPSHISALMSGVMIKTGLYMLIRICFDFFPMTPEWWGIVLLILGSISSLLGVLYALAEHDLKKLLAYHSIENVGIILLGMGSALVFLSIDMKSAALVGLIASLFHTMNHAIFKALLFLGAGAVIEKTHTRNIEEYGGLIKHMPLTAFFFLVGSMAISALPPFNGFFSEWFTFQSLFNITAPLSGVAKIALVLAIGALAFTGGLAVACFVKAFGITFLARPRSDEAKHAREVDTPQIIGMGFLAILTLVIGFFAAPVVRFFEYIGMSMQSFSGMTSAITTDVWHIQTGFVSLSMPVVLAVLLLALCCIFLLVYSVSGKQKVRLGHTWDCGSDLNSRMEITATGFSRSIITVFKKILRPMATRHTEYYDKTLHHFPKFIEVTLGLKEIYQSTFYKGMYEVVTKISEWVKHIQGGSVNAYISYMFMSLLVLLIALMFIL